MTTAEHRAQARAVTSATAWTTIGFGASQIFRLGGNIILAAILFQEAFALMAIASAVLQGLAMFSDIGLAPSVVQNRRGDDREFLNTAWTIQVIRGVFLTLISFALSWPLAAFYAQNDPAAWVLAWLLPLLTLTTLISGFFSSKLMTAARHMNVARLTMVDMAAQVTTMVVMISTAWYTRSVYALALGSVAGAAVQCFLSHFAIPGERNRFRLEREATREIIKFGKWIFLSTLITFLAMQLDRLAFGRLFPLADVGVYAIAASLAILPPMLMGKLQTLVAFPLYSRMLDRQIDLEPALDTSKRLMLALAGYLVALAIVCAQPFIDVAYDDRYSAAGIYISILSAGAWFAVIDGIYGAAFLAKGHAQWVALVNGTKVLAFALLLLPATHVAGLLGAVAAVAASDVIKLGVTFLCARKVNLTSRRVEIRLTLYTVAVTTAAYWLTMMSPLTDGWASATVLIFQFVLISTLFLPHLIPAVRLFISTRASSVPEHNS